MTHDDEYDEASAAAESTGTRPFYVVGLDDSAGSAAALRWAVHKTTATDGEVYAVAVYHARTLLPPIRSQYVPAEVPFGEEEWQSALAAARTMLDRALAGSPDSPRRGIEVAAVAGDPAQVLVELSADADALVLGASHHAGLAARVLGSTAISCATNAACPVMIVPASWTPQAKGRPQAVQS